MWSRVRSWSNTSDRGREHFKLADIMVKRYELIFTTPSCPCHFTPKQHILYMCMTGPTICCSRTWPMQGNLWGAEMIQTMANGYRNQIGTSLSACIHILSHLWILIAFFSKWISPLLPLHLVSPNLLSPLTYPLLSKHILLLPFPIEVTTLQVNSQ